MEKIMEETKSADISNGNHANESSAVSSVCKTMTQLPTFSVVADANKLVCGVGAEELNKEQDSPSMSLMGRQSFADMSCITDDENVKMSETVNLTHGIPAMSDTDATSASNVADATPVSVLVVNRVNAEELEVDSTNVKTSTETSHSTGENAVKKKTVGSWGEDVSACNDVLAGCNSELSFQKLSNNNCTNDNSAVDTSDCPAVSVKGETIVSTDLQPFEQMQAAVESGTDCSSSDEESLTISANIIVNEPGEGSALDTIVHKTQGPLVPGELTIYDLPPLADLTIDIDKEVVLSELGSVLNILECLVIVKANPGTPALDEETVLFLQNRRSVGKVFETFGPVVSPFYSMRFNSTEDVANSKLNIGDKLFFASAKEKSLTNYVFVDRLKRTKGSDASWSKHHEPPEKFLDYSDDEQERKAKAKHRTRGRCAANDLEQSDGSVGHSSSVKKMRSQHDGLHASSNSGTTRFTRPPWRGPPPPPDMRHPPPGEGGYGAWPAHPQYYPPHYTQANYPPPPRYHPTAFGAPPTLGSGWQSYGSTWTAKDSSFYSEETDKPASKFVDTRFVQQNTFSSDKGT